MALLLPLNLLAQFNGILAGSLDRSPRTVWLWNSGRSVMPAVQKRGSRSAGLPDLEAIRARVLRLIHGCTRM